MDWMSHHNLLSMSTPRYEYDVTLDKVCPQILKLEVGGLFVGDVHDVSIKPHESLILPVLKLDQVILELQKMIFCFAR